MESIIMMVAVIAVFYFMMIRPENKRKKALEDMRNSLKKGDKLTTIGGIVGTIVQINNDTNTVIIETSEDRVRMEITKWAVSQTGVQSSAEAAVPEKKKTAAIEEAVPEEPGGPSEET